MSRRPFGVVLRWSCTKRLLHYSEYLMSKKIDLLCKWNSSMIHQKRGNLFHISERISQFLAGIYGKILGKLEPRIKATFKKKLTIYISEEEAICLHAICSEIASRRCHVVHINALNSITMTMGAIFLTFRRKCEYLMVTHYGSPKNDIWNSIQYSFVIMKDISWSSMIVISIKLTMMVL